MPKFQNNVDLNYNELQKAVIQNSPSAPGTGVVGQVYYNTSSGKLFVCTNATGPVWSDLVTSATAGMAFGSITDGSNTAVADAASDTFTISSANNMLSAAVNAAADSLTLTINAGNIDHGALAGRADDDHSGYPWMSGRSGGQSIAGGTASGDDLTLLSTSHGTKGDIIIGSAMTVSDATGATTFGGTGVANITLTPANMNGSSAVFRLADDETFSEKFKITGQGNVTALGSVTASSFSGSGASLTSLNMGNAGSGTLVVSRGGTGATTLTSGGVVYGNGTSALAATSQGTTSQVLIGGTTPSFGSVNLTSMVGSSILPVANGGTGASTLTSKGILFGNGTSAVSATSSANNAILRTDGSGNPSLSTTLPAFTMAGNIAMGSNSITGLATPSADTDAATKGYVDSVALGLDFKASVRVATTANITLSGTQTIDGVSVIATNRVLVKNQSAPADNGIYVCAAGAWTRASDADTSAEVTAGMFVFVEEGSTQADTGWVLTTNNAITLGTTGLSFTQFSGAGSYTAGTGISISGTVIGVSTALGAVNTIVNSGATGIFAVTGSSSVASRTITGTSNKITVTNGDGVSGNPTLTVGSDIVQITGSYADPSWITSLAGSKISGNISGNAANVTGTVAVANGGTGATSAANARTNLSSTANGLPQKYTVDIGNGSLKTFTVTHNLGTRAVKVAVVNNSTYVEEYPDVESTTTNTVTVTFGAGSAPSSNAYNVAVIA